MNLSNCRIMVPGRRASGRAVRHVTALVVSVLSLCSAQSMWAANGKAASVVLDFSPLPSSTIQQSLNLREVQSVDVVLRADASDEDRANNKKALDLLLFPLAAEMNFQQQLNFGAVDKLGQIRLRLAPCVFTLKMEGKYVSPKIKDLEPETCDAEAVFKHGSMQSIKRATDDAVSFAGSPAFEFTKPLISWFDELQGKRLQVGQSISESFDLPQRGMFPPSALSFKTFRGNYTLRRIEHGVAYLDFDIGMDNADCEASATATPNNESSHKDDAATGGAMSGANRDGAPTVAGVISDGCPHLSGQGKLQYSIRDHLALTYTYDLHWYTSQYRKDGHLSTMRVDFALRASQQALGGKPPMDKRTALGK